MAPHITRRCVASDTDEMDTLQSGNIQEQDEAEKRKLQQDELGKEAVNRQAYGGAEFTTVIAAPRQCDQQGTEEAEIASRNQPQLSKWANFHLEAGGDSEVTVGDVRNPHRHRAGVKAALREDAAKLGLGSVQQLSLDDTYVNPGKQGRSFGGKAAAAPSQRPFASKSAVGKQSVFPKHINKGKGQKPDQVRPWPPAALTGMIAVTTGGPSAQTSFKKVANGDAVTQNTPAKERAAPASQMKHFSLAGPSDFMAALRAKSGQPAQQMNKASEAAAPHVVDKKKDEAVVPTTNVTPKVAREIFVPKLQSPLRQEISTEDFSFTKRARLDPGEISTYTDGAPSPQTLSVVSASSASHVHDLIGLGIDDLDTNMRDAPTVVEIQKSSSASAEIVAYSPAGTIMDSPILDDVKSEVLSAEPGEIIEIAGRKYISVDELLALQAAIENQLAAAGSKAGASKSSKPITEAVVTEFATTAMPLSATPLTTKATFTQTQHANPFAVREPLLESDVNITGPALAPASTATTTAETDKSGKVVRRSPFTSKEEIKSKWATEVDLAPARRQPFTSKDTIKSRWADDETPAPVRQPLIPVRSATPIFGDRYVFGAEGTSYTPASKRPTNKARTFQKPGPGFDSLVSDLAKLKVSNGDKKT